MELFTFAQAHLQFNAAIFEIEGKGNQCQTFLLDFAVQPHDFPFMHQQFPYPKRVTVEHISLFIGTDVHAFDKQLAVINRAPAVFQVDTALTERLDLGSNQFNTGFKGLQHKIIMPGFAVDRNGFSTCRHGQHHLSLHGDPIFQRLIQRRIIGVFQLTADRDTECKSRYPNSQRL